MEVWNIAIVEVKTNLNQYVPCRVLLDSASQMNFITKRCVQRLKLTKNKKQVSILVVNNVNTVTYGTSAAPYLATRCLKKLAEDNQTEFPRAAEALSKEFMLMIY